MLTYRDDVVFENEHGTAEQSGLRLALPKILDEAASQTGEEGVGLGTLFQVLLESVEVTAMQRACGRWSP